MKEMQIPPSTISYYDRHKLVVKSKANTIKGVPNTTKTNLLQLEPKILARYTEFEQAVSKNSLFDFLEDPTLNIHKDDLLSCYTGRTGKVKEIFKLIENSQPIRFLKRCPYCGITLPKTYDHYLPEAHFPELSVHALNLIPCCGTCNSTKNNIWKNQNHRTFLYLYKDRIPNIKYIDVKITTKKNSIGATFSIKKPPNTQDPIWNIIIAHYEKLSLISQYNELSNDEITEIFNTCVTHIRCGGTNVKKFLKELLKPEEKLYGINHWRVVLMKGLAANPDFTDLVNSNA